MLISVYVPCYNGSAHLDELLGALEDQTRSPDEIVVVDDGSTDETADRARRAGARVITHNRNRGIAAARNSALSVARGDVLVGLDADAIPAPDYVETVARAFEGDPELAAVCGRLIEAHTTLLPDRWREVHMAQHHGLEPCESPRICYGSVTSVRKSAVHYLGGWNDKYRRNYEDVDLTERMRDAGLRTAYEPACVARHQRRDSLHSVLTGFWHWFAPRGEDAGHFDSIDALVRDRIAAVNWGIHLHRMAADLDQCRAHLVGPTFLLPWWMALHDLARVGGARDTARALLERFPEIVSSQGASDYVEERSAFQLAWLYAELFANVGSTGGSAHARYLEAFGTVARQHLPRDRFAWGRIEFSLRRQESEERLAEEWENDCRVLLANPPWYTADRQGVRAGSRWSFSMDRRDDRPIPRYLPFPFFLAQAAETLNSQRHPNVIVDAIAEGLTRDEFHERANGYEPRVVVMETSAASFENDRTVWERLRADLPETLLVLAGPHATARRTEILQTAPQVDAILIGEYEATLAAAARRWAKGEEIASLKGLAVRRRGEIIDTGRPDPVPFEQVGQADRLRLPMYNYRDTFGNLREPVAQLMATRGCPYECSFCQWPQVFYERRTIQRRSVDSVFNEIEELVTRYGFRTVYFDDDMFSPGKEWLARFVERIAGSGLKFDWGIMSRADTFGAEQLEAMAGAGLRAAKFGVESGDQEMVDTMGKRLDLDTLRRTIASCRDIGISVHLTFTVGLPGESHQTLARTRELILELMPDTLQISRAMPLPGTSLEDWAVEHGAMKTGKSAALDGFLTSVLEYPGLSGEDMDRFIEQTYADYRLKLGAAHSGRENGPGGLDGRDARSENYRLKLSSPI